MSSSIGRSYVIRLFRQARLTKAAANELYDLIKEDIEDQLQKGQAVNLFSLVTLKPYKHTSREIKGSVSRVIKDAVFRVKAKMNKRFLERLRILNRQRGGTAEEIK